MLNIISLNNLLLFFLTIIYIRYYMYNTRYFQWSCVRFTTQVHIIN